jgi:predicted MFS family arabinose efflux permease
MCMTTTLQDPILADTVTEEAPTKTSAGASAVVRRRLRPVYVAGFFLGINFWVPVEKLFLSKIGFNAASVGLLAATYAVVVPFLEIPSGILADRWSRRGVLIIADVALAASSLVGGASHNVPTYLVAALLLGCYFALQSGTVDSIIYDVLIEETGNSDGFVKEMGRLRLLESVALVSSALAGGLIAAVLTPRITYFLTVPFTVLAIVALMRIEEPSLHRADDAAPLRAQIATTYRTIVERGRLRPIIVAMVLCALVLQMLVEFGPLWMVALAAPAVLYGPQWAGLMSAMGLGGVLAGRFSIGRRTNVIAMVVMMLACGLTLTTSHNTVVVIVAQVALVLLLVTVSTQLTQQLHDAIPSSIRSGVSSGVGTITWMMFVPTALTFGLLSRHLGVLSAGWMLVALTAGVGASMCRLAIGRGAAADADWTQAVVSRLPVIRAD